MAEHPYHWPIFRQVCTRASQTERMIERLDVNPAALARDHSGDLYAEIRRTCFECRNGDQCREWLDSGDPSEPGFCPNLETLLKFRHGGRATGRDH